MDKTQLIQNYSSRIEDALGNMYSNGYNAGYTEGKKEVEHMRAACTRIKGKHDSEYAEQWDDDTPFYGWCNECERPHSGRWAHMWDFCPWCGAQINHDAEVPYPTRMNKECESDETLLPEINTTNHNNNEARIGDEFIDDIGRRCIAMRNTYYQGSDKEPFTLVWYGAHLSSSKLSSLKKTGRRFPQIVDILEILKEE